MPFDSDINRSQFKVGVDVKCGICKCVCAALIMCFAVCGCAKTNHKNRKPVSTSEPNASVTYEKGRDFVGVVKKVDAGAKTITFYNTALEEEAVCEYSGSTEILTKNSKQLSSESLQVGQVVDVYRDSETGRLTKVQLSSDIVEYEGVKGMYADADAGYIEINGTKYRYGSGFSAYSGGQPVDIQEISETDEITFRGIKGKAYSVVVTKGHGYLRPVKYKDFVGGTMTVGGVMIVPVTDNMLVPIPEGTYEVSMKNGDYVGSRTVNIERDQQMKLDMSKFKSLAPNTGQVTFDIDPVGAELYVNGTLTDYTKPVPLKYGKHSIRVLLEGYTTYFGVLDVKSAGPTVSINLADEKAEVPDGSDDTSVKKDNSTKEQSVSGQSDNQHTITVSEPIGASVYMDGTFKGTAPCSFPKKIGTVTITLSMAGLTTKSYTMKTLDDGKDVAWSFPELQSPAVG